MKYFLLLLSFLLIFVPEVEARAEGTLIIPSISLYAPINYEPIADRNYDLTDLGYGVARLEGTSWNDPFWGRTVLVGHTPGGFSYLMDVAYGDRIILLSDKYIFEYVVDTIQIVEIDDVYILNPTDTPTLTLITCYNNAQQRLVVSAYLKEYYDS